MKNRLQRQRGKKWAADTPGQQLCPPSQTNCSGSAPRFCHEMILRPCTSKTAHPRNVYLSPSTLNAVSRNGGNIPDPFRTRRRRLLTPNGTSVLTQFEAALAFLSYMTLLVQITLQEPRLLSPCAK